ncbi:hypothetical protein JKA74_06530 [Marivirga sp. S37H4]|uniref:Uncharacterized protein n=1 Tax=Marivirga aurantiaca TaxID=2802615 RepID=A0A935C6X6_9BACT|nr:hypothetical protein [Marivirga aurantiaca]MBK6264686.1 hypothetical protein [Marivirga aurantiaca]
MTKTYFILFLLTGFLLVDNQVALSQDTYFRGFYHGRNVFVRNPYIESEKQFCIQSIYLNGKKITDSPGRSAYELSMEDLPLDSRVVIRIVHHNTCKPELINPEVIQNDLKFSWLKLYVNEESIIWITTKEDKEGRYVIQRESAGEWETIDSTQAKGGIFINQHSKELDHNKGDNTYRVLYKDPQGEIMSSDEFNYFSDKSEISHVIDTDKWSIEFTEEVSFQLLNAGGRIIMRGKSVSCDIRKLPYASYIIRYEGKDYPFEKKK